MRHVVFLNGIWPVKQGIKRPHLCRSISCYQLKHWLSHFGIRSQVIDFCPILSADEIFELLEQFVTEETVAIGVSVTFWPADKSTPENLAELFPRIRDRWPKLKIVAGGARRPWTPDPFDEIFVGDSEDKFVTWCQAMTGKTALSAFNKKFNIVDLAHRFDDWDAIMPGEALPIELGRGCIFKCKFCAHQNLGKAKHTYQRRFDLLLDEIEYNYSKFGTTRYNFLDDTVNEDMDKVRNFSTVKDKTGIDLQWVGYLRADLVWSQKESAELLQQSGLTSCFFGIETFHGQAGRSIDKGWGAKHGKDYLPKLYHDLWDGKINMHINMIAGLPFESTEHLRESLNWCKSNDLGFHQFVPLTLYVEKADSENASSEFTRNYLAHGYRNVDSNSGYWESDQTNMTEMMNFCEAAKEDLRSINRVASWDVFNATNLGYEPADVMQWNFYDFVEVLKDNKDVFKTRYLEKLKSLST
jgi:radical SAM superfamily enzyme YgiQ (UPF0313 family)